jgi:para-aminobenzoate synthetase / 4-amino-4-deoxychorismate lyase
MTNASPKVRFDDMRARTSSVFTGFLGELRADHVDQVPAVLEAVVEAARDGRWCGGFLTYECAPAFDKGLRVHEADPEWCVKTPLAWFGVYEDCATTPLRLPRASRTKRRAPWRAMTSEDDYRTAVRSILGDIELGNVYQVNFTDRMVTREPGDLHALYRQLLTAQQPSYGALIEVDGTVIVSASPELFIDWDGERLQSRPMKGTIRRGRWSQEDAELSRELENSPKETAENIMIVDLIRNDMGKVAVFGSVTTPHLRTLEAYPNVWQLVSEVECTTRPGIVLGDVFAAMFPCGSVTGAPKQSAMGIIASLETTPRGVYCGAVGMVRPGAAAPRAQFSVAIRTAVIDLTTAEARFGSGGGVVAASRPDDEYREMTLKSEMLNATGVRPFRLLETFRHTPGVVNDKLERHLARMRSSADFFGFRVPDDLDARVARKLAEVDYDARVRVLLARSGTVEVLRAAAPPPQVAPVRLAIDDDPVDSQSPMLFHKTTERALYLSRRKRHPDADDVVLVNERGECTEVTTANLAVRFGSVWLTPPVSAGCLPGVERAGLLERGELTEATLRPEDLVAADELAVVNSLRGWRTAVLADSR